MTTREKIILGLVAAAAAGGGIHLLMPSGSGSRDASAKAEPDFSALIETVQEGLQAGELSPREEHTLASASTRWLRDPLRTRPVKPMHDGTTEQIPMPSYTGFINTGPRPIAIIDGHDYRSEEPVRGGEFQVISIFADRVELLRRGASDPVLIPLTQQGEDYGGSD